MRQPVDEHDSEQKRDEEASSGPVKRQMEFWTHRLIRRLSGLAPEHASGRAGGRLNTVRGASRWWLALSLVVAGVSFAELVPPGLKLSGALDMLRRPAGRVGTTVVPDLFLRSWDPITIFFAGDRGPANGGPIAQPPSGVSLLPEQPGTWVWLDARTLQFKPAEAWQPLASVSVSVDGKTFPLQSLMDAPISTEPAPNAEGLTGIDTLFVTFAQSVEPSVLAQMLEIELRPLPGVDEMTGQQLPSDAWTLKMLERTGRNEPVRYRISMRNPLPAATRVLVRFKRALDPRSADALYEWSFSTAEPFRVSAMGCREQRLPLAPEGSRYAREQALACGASPERRSGSEGDGQSGRAIVLQFSSQPETISLLQARALVRFEPTVDHLTVTQVNQELEVRGDFRAGLLYRLTLNPISCRDVLGRPLAMTGASSLFFHFPSSPSYVKLDMGEGILERFGPQMIPLSGQGDSELDLRIHAIDPMEPNLWPFPSTPVEVAENQAPPPEGETLEPLSPVESASEEHLTKAIGLLSTPLLSTRVALPLRQKGSAGAFGLDLAPHLARAVGSGQPGHYLVGVRRLNGSLTRAWARIQVTDLSLTTAEEADRVVFQVTSLSSAEPIKGANVYLDVIQDKEQNGTYQWNRIFSGATDATGRLSWNPPGALDYTYVKRLVVQKDQDVLVLDLSKERPIFSDNYWATGYESWLQWGFQDFSYRKEPETRVAHVFTERPVYRPEEEVHIAGYLRRREKGSLLLPPANTLNDYKLTVVGPGDLSWSYPVTISPTGSFYHRFLEDERPTGFYQARLEDADGVSYGSVSFQLDAYRIPTFEVQLHSPDLVPLDRPFDVDLSASFYAGGKVAGAPIRWRVTQFPYYFGPKTLPGYLYSSDARFSSGTRFESRPELVRQDVTTDDGLAHIDLDPGLEPNAQPREYLVEATVTGDDDQTVTATRRVVAAPAFVVGVKVPRYIEKTNGPSPTTVTAQVVVVDTNGKLKAGQSLKLTLLQRQWHSHLQTGDFSDGVARYVTDVVDEKVLEKPLVSTGEPLPVSLPLTGAGVYVLELEARDRLGRSQTVSVDFFSGGSEPVAWKPAEAGVFQVTPDKSEYLPGETASLVVQSPYQTANALVVIEAPDRNDYQWARVQGGKAVVQVPIRGVMTPSFPVHVVLMRGRVKDANPVPGSTLDPGRPTTLASTAWLEVKPLDNRVTVTLEHPEKAGPGTQLPITLKLADPAGKPLAGEVALWMVDQAVLSLGKEKKLDPLPVFLRSAVSRLRVRDSRAEVLGWLPFQEMPGGDGGESEDADLLDRVTVRKNFKTVPYFNPAIAVGPNGTAKVVVDLPDNLTVFRLRAKGVSGSQRFGFATGKVAVRLPVQIQPVLPRFVRPGDTFVAGALGRIVEGPGGAGKVQARFTGLTRVDDAGKPAKGEAASNITLDPKQSARVGFRVTVPTPAYLDSGLPSSTSVSLKFGVERTRDKVGDAFEIALPIQPDRQPEVLRLFSELAESAELPAVPADARPGTVSREVMVSDQPALVRLAAGMASLQSYPYGCTEQRISKARAAMALRQLRSLMKLEDNSGLVAKAIAETQEQIKNTLDPQGLVAYWPGSEGTVSLTAWALEFLMEAKDAGFPVKDPIQEGLVQALQRSLRSDYGHFVDGRAWEERAWALSALARARKFDAGYGAELLRQAQMLNQEGQARVLLAFAASGDTTSPAVKSLGEKLWQGVSFQLYQGKERYAGLISMGRSFNPLVLEGETRSLAGMLRALRRVVPEMGGEPTPGARLKLLQTALIERGGKDGWGSTNANAEAARALSEFIKPPFAESQSASLQVQLGDGLRTVRLSPETPIVMERSTTSGAGSIKRVEPAVPGHPLIVRAEARFIPGAPGSQMAAQSQGFVVSRTVARVPSDGGPLQKQALNAPGITLNLKVGDVVEEQVQVVNPEEAWHVAIVVPLAAGVEVLNPRLATAAPEARPSAKLTLEPTYSALLDDKVAYYFNHLPKGTYDFYFRTRATIEGRFIQPGATSELMYDDAVRGQSPGALVTVVRAEGAGADGARTDGAKPNGTR